MYHNIVFFY